MKKLLLLLLFIPLVSFGQAKNEEVKTYYESGELETIVNIVDGLQQGEEKWYYKTEELSLGFQKIISDFKLNYSLVKYDGDHRIFPDELKNISDNF